MTCPTCPNARIAGEHADRAGRCEERLAFLIAELRHKTARWQDTTDPTRPLDVAECCDELDVLIDRYTEEEA